MRMTALLYSSLTANAVVATTTTTPNAIVATTDKEKITPNGVLPGKLVFITVYILNYLKI
jgi:hypothetical protein